MYKIFADDQIIYSDINNMDMFRLADPELDLADNTSGTLTMTLPPSNVGYDLIKRLTTKIRVTRFDQQLKRDVEIWAGRAISEEVDFWKNKKITCEGELGYLNDTLQPQREWEFKLPSSTANDPKMVYTFLTDILAVHNSKVPVEKQFRLGAVTVTDNMENEDSGTDEYYDDVYVYTNYDTTLSCIMTKLVDKLGGHLKIRKENGVRYLDYLKDFTSSSEQTIQFGWNLMDFVTNYDESEFCTVLIPLGERYTEGEIDGLEGYLDISSVNNGKNYLINQNTYNNFGWIERVEHFDNITDENELKQKGQEFLNDVQFGKMTLEISAVDLAYYDINYDEINLLDEVRVKSIPHGLDRVFPVTELRIPLDNPGNSTFTLGAEGISSMSGLSNSITKSMGNISGNGGVQPSSNSTMVQLAQRNARAIMDTISTGFITIDSDKNEATGGLTKSQALYISNLPDIDASTKRWKWNLGGLAYQDRSSASNKWNDPKVAITMDGAIVADFITAGTLNAGIIKAGTLQDAGENVVFDLDNGQLDIKKGSIKLGYISENNYNFTVDNNGIVAIKKGSINLGLTNGVYNFTVNDSGVVAINKGSINLGQNDDGSYNFKVTSKGILTAKGANFSGTVTGSTITGSTIKGSTITTTKSDNGFIKITEGQITGHYGNTKYATIDMVETWTGAGAGKGLRILSNRIGLGGVILIRKESSGNSNYTITWNVTNSSDGGTNTGVVTNQSVSETTYTFDDKGRLPQLANQSVTFVNSVNWSNRSVINGLIV